jgi:NAD(P)-dependent dehydrogenase (short-subunit alcohol dehydrogenase family)
MGDRHVVITGASSGLGRAAAMRLAARGAELTLVIRSEDKARELLDAIHRETGNHRIHIELADLSLMAEVDALARRLRERGRAVDVLINNAGALFNPRQVTPEGLEKSFALLLLSPFRLTLGLHPLLVEAQHARVVNVVSGGMYTQALDVDTLQAPEADYSGSVAYARCKRALMVLTEQWARDWVDQGIVVNAMHPGWADTPGVRGALPGFHRLTRRVLRSPAEGADTMVWLAVATEAGKVTGALFLDREPRTTHLKNSTREPTAERERLRACLARFAPPAAAGERPTVDAEDTAA